ncbi:putative DNA-binding transcriptional regulator AlpA [Bradyrhizobium japonicum]|uniref:helix-turn-helix transcriptional regulator n=1 Tax=Bradyrhizobium TaxID=374 RepID=UPI0004B1E728|nr:MULTISPECIES: AlpA family phage regulatory protein [Bradyrhizobium]MDI2073899.1 hypothetical protein [Bradyrhizobium sp. Mp27]
MTNPKDDDPTPTPPDFINLREVMRMTCRSKSSVYEDPGFPQPISFSEPGRARRHARWLRHEVEAWLQERIAERDARAPQRRQELRAQRERRLARRRASSNHRSVAET